MYVELFRTILISARCIGMRFPGFPETPICSLNQNYFVGGVHTASLSLAPVICDVRLLCAHNSNFDSADTHIRSTGTGTIFQHLPVTLR